MEGRICTKYLLMGSKRKVAPGPETTKWNPSGQDDCKIKTFLFVLFLSFRKGGLTYLGQDQDSLGGDFNPRQSWSGLISQFNIWNWALEDYFIENAAECRSDLLGNVQEWLEGKWFTGKVKTVYQRGKFIFFFAGEDEKHAFVPTLWVC